MSMVRSVIAVTCVALVAACGQMGAAKDKAAAPPPADQASTPAATPAGDAGKPGDPASAGDAGKPGEPAQAPAGAAPDKPA